MQRRSAEKIYVTTCVPSSRKVLRDFKSKSTSPKTAGALVAPSDCLHSARLQSSCQGCRVILRCCCLKFGWCAKLKAALTCSIFTHLTEKTKVHTRQRRFGSRPFVESLRVTWNLLNIFFRTCVILFHWTSRSMRVTRCIMYKLLGAPVLLEKCTHESQLVALHVTLLLPLSPVQLKVPLKQILNLKTHVTSSL